MFKIIFSIFLRRHNSTIRCYDVLLFFCISWIEKKPINILSHFYNIIEYSAVSGNNLQFALR
jgi:hypothetical protein